MEFVRNKFDNTLIIIEDFDTELKFVGDYGNFAHTIIKIIVNGGFDDLDKDRYLDTILMQSFSDKGAKNGNGANSLIELRYQGEILKLNEDR